MKKFSQIELLDYVFLLIKSEHGKFTKPFIRTHLAANQIEFTEDHLDMILRKISEDGYVVIETTSNAPHLDTYKISLDGYLFDGYSNKLKRKVISNRNKRIQTLILVVGTALAGLYGFFEIMKWLFHHEGWRLLF